jgi:hypothetical protein
MKRKSKECPKCKAKYQTWVELDGPHECFNEFGFTDYGIPIYVETCTACRQEKDLVDNR